MNTPNIMLGAFDLPEVSGSASAAFVGLIPPFQGQGLPSLVNAATLARGYAHITSIGFTCTAASKVTVLRPLNWTTFYAAAAGAQKVCQLSYDPGVYSYQGRFRGGSFPGVTYSSSTTTLSVADNILAANDYVVYQCADGYWVADTVAVVPTTYPSANCTFTTNIPAAGVLAGAPVYFMGIASDVEPLTGKARPSTTFAASSARATWTDTAQGIVTAHFAGDPLLVYNPNADQTCVLNFLTGYYADR